MVALRQAVYSLTGEGYLLEMRREERHVESCWIATTGVEDASSQLRVELVTMLEKNKG